MTLQVVQFQRSIKLCQKVKTCGLKAVMQTPYKVYIIQEKEDSRETQSQMRIKCTKKTDMILKATNHTQ